MAKPVVLPTTFASETGNQPASQLDNNFSPLALAINDYSTYSTYLTDTGAVNAMVATVAGPLTFSYSNNVSIDLLVAITNTSATVTLNVNAIGAVTIKDASGNAPAVGALLAGTVYRLNHDGVNFRVQGAVGGVQSFKQLTVGVPAAGVALTVTGITNGRIANFTDATETLSLQTDASHNMFLGTDGAHALNLFTNSSVNIRVVVAAAGNVTINAPSAGTALTVNGVGGNTAFFVNGAATVILFQGNNPGNNGFGTNTTHDFSIVANGANRTTWSTAGNVVMNAPTSGVPLTVAGGAIGGNNVVSLTSSAANQVAIGFAQSGQTSFVIYNPASSNDLRFFSGSDRVIFGGSGNVTINAPSGGVALTVSAFAGTHSTKIADSANNSFNAGYLESPPNTQNANYTTVLSDSGKTIYHSDGVARTYTIDSNANVAYPVGTILAFENDASGAVNVTISITTDVLVLSPLGSTGSRTLAQFGRAVARKVTVTRWTIAGSGLS